MGPGNHTAKEHHTYCSHLGLGRTSPANATTCLCVLVTLRAPPAIYPCGYPYPHLTQCPFLWPICHLSPLKQSLPR